MAVADPKRAPVPVYSNVVNLRTTPTELVLDFGTFFAESSQAAQVGPKDFNPEVTVVMHISALAQLIQAFSRAAEAHKAALEQQQEPPTAKAQ